MKYFKIVPIWNQWIPIVYIIVFYIVINQIFTFNHCVFIVYTYLLGFANRMGIPLSRGVLVTTLCDKVCQWLAKDRWFSSGTPVSSTNKTDRQNITEILLKVALNTINQTKPLHDIKDV